MAKQNKVSKYWAGFHRSAEYQACLVYPVSMVKRGLETIFESLPTTVNEWDVPDFADFLGELSHLALTETDERANQIFEAMYTIITAFLRYIAKQQLITATPAALELFLADYEAQNAILFDGVDDDLNVDINEDPTLPEWQERTAVNIRNYTNDWLSEYTHSADWKKRPKGVNEAFLTVVLNELVQRGYNYYRKTPKSWNKRVLVNILQSTMITEYEFSADEYALIVPMMTNFLQFVSNQGWLNAKRAADYQHYLQAGEAGMIASAKDFAENPNAISIINQKMTEAGIDPDEPDAIEKFMDELEATGGFAELYDQLYGNETGEDELDEDFSAEDSSPDELEKIVNNPKTFANVAHVYDPDEGQNYLTFAHQSTNDGWRKKDAIDVHLSGVQAGLRLWFHRQNKSLPVGWEAPEVVANVSEVVDVLYAQRLVTPSEWTTKIFSWFGQWLKNNRSQTDYQDIILLLTSLVAELTTAGILTPTQGDQLPAAIKTTDTPKPASLKKVKGKVISMKQARKLLKNKKRH